MAMGYVGNGTGFGGDDFEFTVSGGHASVTYVVAMVLQTPSVEQATTVGVTFGGDSLGLISSNTVAYNSTFWLHEMWGAAVSTPSDAQLAVDRSGDYNATYCGAMSFSGGGVRVDTASASDTAHTGNAQITLTNADADAIYVSALFVAQGLSGAAVSGTGHTATWSQGTGVGAAHGGSYKLGSQENPSTDMIWTTSGTGRMMLDGMTLVDVAEGITAFPDDDTGGIGGGGSDPIEIPPLVIWRPGTFTYDHGGYGEYKANKTLASQLRNARII